MEQIINSVGEIKRTAAQLSVLSGAAGVAGVETECMASSLKQGANALVVATQFFDRFSQRIETARECLDLMSAANHDFEVQRTSMWRDALKRMRSLYSLEQEMALAGLLENEEFQVLAPVEESVEKGAEKGADKTGIELF
ncbi:MAG: hypothetical protein H6978_13410 [Gammaproteobacteria bacterium]|nr:hypothetical protein [Gammaproteobacteria bacterium]